MTGRVKGAVIALLAAGLTACTPEPPPLPPSSSPVSLTAAPTPTPIDGLPDDHTLSAVNGHTAAGAWAFITTATGDPVGVRVNGLWQGEAGSLGDRSYSQPPSQTPVDVDTAIPYFLSWSYVVLAGSSADDPAAIVLPTPTGNLYNVDSPFSDHDCPDYQPIVAQSVGFLITRCAVSLSPDGAYPTGLAFAVPGQTKQYWFLDAPAAVALPK